MGYSNLFDLRDKAAVVTGGAGLIGKEIARALCDFGAKVYIADKDEKAASSLLGDSRIKFIRFDITSEDSVKKGLKKIKQDNGRIDILVNSAYPKTRDWPAKLEKIRFDSWKKNVNDHLGGYFLCCRAASEWMKKQPGGGAIVNLASIYGMYAPDFSIYKGTVMTMPAAYAAIKGGIIAFTRYVASYYGRYNIRANCISPGGVYDNQPRVFVKRYIEKTALGRMASAQDVVGAVLYLVSDASKYVTGQNLVVDGGWR